MQKACSWGVGCLSEEILSLSHPFRHREKVAHTHLKWGGRELEKARFGFLQRTQACNSTLSKVAGEAERSLHQAKGRARQGRSPSTLDRRGRKAFGGVTHSSSEALTEEGNEGEAQQHQGSSGPWRAPGGSGTFGLEWMTPEPKEVTFGQSWWWPSVHPG